MGRAVVSSPAAENISSDASIGLGTLELPEEWAIADLGDLFDIQQGKALSPKSRTGNNRRPFLRTANVLWGRLDISTIDQMNFTDEETERLSLRNGDLLVCEGGDVGRTAVWREEIESCSYQNHLHRLRKRREGILPEFYMYWMQVAMQYLGIYVGEENRTTIPNLSKARLSRFRVPVPPLDEQRQIVAILEAAHKSKVATEKVIAATRELKRSLMQYLFKYGPVRIHETERVLLRETEIGPLPAHWRVARLSDVMKEPLSNGIFIKNPKWGSGLSYLNVADAYAWPVVRVESLARVDVGGDVRDRFLVEEGDVVFVRSSLKREGVAMACMVPSTQQPVLYDCHLIRLSPDQSQIIPLYLVEYCRSGPGHARLVSLSKTTTMTTIPQANLSSFVIPLPPLGEQEQISTMAAAIDAKIEAEHSNRDGLDSVFAACLSDLMTGRRRVAQLEVE